MTTINEYLLIRPDWGSSFFYRRAWKNALLISLTGIEQRSSLFTWPRRTLNFSILFDTYGQGAYLKRKFFKNLHNVWGVPFWEDKTTLTSQANFGQKILNVGSTQYRNFEVGGTCLIMQSENAFEAGEVDSFSSSQITLKENLVNTWGSGLEVYPVMKSRIKSGQGIEMLTSRIGRLNIEAMEEYDDAITRHIGDASSFPTYGGISVFDLWPNWGKVELKFFHPYDWLFYLGKGITLSHYNESALGLKAEYLELTKEEIQKALDFFDAQMGKWGFFWLPSWQEDIRITEPFGAGDTILTIQDIDFASYWLNTGAGNRIFIIWPDKSYVCKQVIGAPTSTTISLSGAVGKACSLNELSSLQVSFLLLSRFDHDEIEVEYLSDEKAHINFSFFSLYEAMS